MNESTIPGMALISERNMFTGHCLVTCTISLFFLFACINTGKAEKIDRHALINRHNIVVEAFDSLASLSVGNGNFAFTTDITGLQTFFNKYEKGVSLGTMSNWGWHLNPNTENYERRETYRYYQVEDRKVPYEDQLGSPARATSAGNYFRENPHRLHLGIIRLVITKENGKEITIDDICIPKHKLNLWNGGISSSFEVEGNPVEVNIFAHQNKDMISAQITSSLIQSQQLAVELLFPYAAAKHTHPGYDFSVPGKHSSVLKITGATSATISRTLDDFRYYTYLSWSMNAKLNASGQHQFVLQPAPGTQTIEFSCLFSPAITDESLPDYESTRRNNIVQWENFWQTGGAVDFSECTDPRARELERRIVLSQYLTKINGTGNLPPQETGLTFNSWYGKFHLEMIWWHSAHYYNWQRPELMSEQLFFYKGIYQKSVEFTRLQGYRGVRWPKMVGPGGNNSPSSVGNFLIWQQPHLIYLAEQLYKNSPQSGVLEEYAELIFATAEFMADFARPDETGTTYILGPPLIPAQEHWDRETTYNPPFELAYWYWGLTKAQEWRKRLNLKPNPKWEEVRTNLAAPFAIDSLYMGSGNAPDSYTNAKNMRDHPMVLGMMGMLPAWEKVNPDIMLNTLRKVMEKWDWHQTWGWDYSMVAMCATRLLEPEIALQALLKDVQKNTSLVNGHNYQDERLRIYLPGNGGLLKAIALMCAGWEGCIVKNPGFPIDGAWDVKWENLNPDF